MDKQQTKEYQLPDYDTFKRFCGQKEDNLRLIEKKIQVGIEADNCSFKVEGHEVGLYIFDTIFPQIVKFIKKNGNISKNKIKDLIANGVIGVETRTSRIQVLSKTIVAKTPSQQEYMESIDNKTITFGIGIAGSGKTLIGVSKAVSLFMEDKFEKIVITRPVVEAGESLGYLPGDLKEKLDPYLMPIYDYLRELLGYKKVEEYINGGQIEILPLAYMRGRTLSKAVIILDEAQNTTIDQMKMFLTRIGKDSKMIITGDPSQSDLPKHKSNGLIHAQNILKNHPDIGLCYMTGADVLRNPIITDILNRYEGTEEEKK